MIYHYAILVLMTLLGSVASLFLKKASETTGIIELIKNKNLYLGGGLYLVSAVLNVWLLKFLDYSIVLPLTSLTYVWTMLLSHKILEEKITIRKVCGVSLVIVGAILVSIKITN